MLGNALFLTLNKLYEIYVEVRKTATWSDQWRLQSVVIPLPNKKLRYREEHSESILLSCCTL